MKKILLLALMAFMVTKGFTQWQKVNLPTGIAVNKLYSSSDKFFVGTSNGVYQLVSGTWSKLSNDINLSVNNLIDYNNYLYAGTSANGMYRSSNGGVSWLQVNNNLTSTAIQDVKLYKNYMVVGTSNGLFMSDNNGVQWTDKSGNITNKNIKAIFTFNDSLFVGTQSGVFMSSDTAKKWKPKNTGLGSKNVSSIISVGSKLFASIADGGVFMSVDTAKNWSIQNNHLTNLNVNTLYYLNDTLFAGTTDSLYYTTNFTTIFWKSLPLKQPSEEVLTIGENNNSLLIGNSYGVYLKKTSFNALNEGFPELKISSLFLYDTLIISSTNLGVWDYNCIKNTWSYDKNIPNKALSGLTKYNDTTQILFNSTGLYASYNRLKAWKKINSKTNISCFTVSDTIIFIGTSTEGVYRSNDFGKTWLPVNIGISPLTVKNIITNDGYLYVYCGGGMSFNSNNSGDEWHALTSNLMYDLNDMISFQKKVFCIAQINHSTIGTGTGIFSNSNNSDNFTKNDSSFIDYHNGHNSFMKLNVIGSTLLAGSEYAGMYISVDKGKNWSQINKGLTYTKANYSGDFDRSYPKITQLLSRNDSTLYFLNDSNQIRYRKLKDIIVPAAPSNFVVKIDTSTYSNYNLAFKWKSSTDPNITEYSLLKLKVVASFKKAPGDTLQLNGLGWWDRKYIDNVKEYRLVSSIGGDLSLPSGYSTIVKQFTGINDINVQNLEVFPNPVKDYLNIKLDNTQECNYKAKIFNTLGVNIYEEKLFGNLSTIDVSKYDAGIYFLEIIDSHNNKKQLKLIKE